MSQLSRAAREQAQLSQAHAQFLLDASDLLLTTAPTTSALLNLQHAGFLSSREELKKQKRQSPTSRPACRACGNLFVGDDSAKTWEEGIRPPHQKRQKQTRTQNPPQRARTRSVMKATMTQCLRCRTVVKRMSVPPSASVPMRSNVTTASEHVYRNVKGTVTSQMNEIKPQQGPPSADPQSENKSAKARAKARKKGGLQAQMDKSKRALPSGDFGLGLMDFMSAG